MISVLLSTISLSAASLSATSAQPVAIEGAPIIVTGQRIDDLRAALESCLARRCPVNEDVDASTALAEALFLRGDTEDARGIIRRSLSRNGGEARLFPEPVADLHRANSRLSRHLGFDRDAERSTRAILRSLQTGIPVEDHRHFGARLELAQSQVAFGRYFDAIGTIEELETRARRAGREDVVIMAELRRTWISYLLAPGDPPRRLLELSRSPDPRRAIGARTLLVRVYSERGDTARANALIAELGRGGGRRQLLYNPPYRLAQQEDVEELQARTEAILNETGGLNSNLAERMVDNYDDKWIEVSFWVKPDGTVDDLMVVRRSNQPDWADPLLDSIRGRRYAPVESQDSTYRLERYTYTASFRDTGTGSRIRARSPAGRVEYFDLTDDAGPSTPPRPGAGVGQND